MLKESDKNNQNSFLNVAIASAITSYSRVYMGEYINNLTGQCYYTDTDSIITDRPISEDKISDKIGEMKLESELEKGYFISPKLYALKTKEGKEIIKSRGIPNNILNWKDFEVLFRGEVLELEIKKIYKTLNDLSINETTIKYRLNLNEEINKRENIYDEGMSSHKTDQNLRIRYKNYMGSDSFLGYVGFILTQDNSNPRKVLTNRW